MQPVCAPRVSRLSPRGPRKSNVSCCQGAPAPQLVHPCPLDPEEALPNELDPVGPCDALREDQERAVLAQAQNHLEADAGQTCRGQRPNQATSTSADSRTGSLAWHRGEVRDRAFETFFTTKSRGEGSGLGLATMYGIVSQSGGYTRIYSDEGVGTSITILLPAAEQDAMRDEIDGRVDQLQATGGNRDDPHSR